MRNAFRSVPPGGRKRMSGKRFRIIFLPPLFILTFTAIIMSLIAGQYEPYFNAFFGRGERYIVNPDNITEEQASYYARNYDSAEDSRNAAFQVALQIAEEGIVLLKNENGVLPLRAGSAVTPFGYDFVHPVYAGTGSAATDTSADYIVTPEMALGTAFSLNHEVIDRMRQAPAEVTACHDGNDGTNLTEYAASVYLGTERSCEDTTGIVFLVRQGMEGYDYNSRIPYSDGTKTQLELTKNERDTIAYAKENCKDVIIVLSCATPMQIVSLQDDPEIDAILWIGLPGAAGFAAAAEILKGGVNPSGRTSALWYADFRSDPTYVNHLATDYTNAVEDGPGCYIEYEEGIYVGYRYYETRYEEDNIFPVFGGQKGYEEAVVYPFGYGLHYENEKVTQTLLDVKEEDGVVTVSGRIDNASSRPVNEVVQIYYGAPYTKGGIEKSAKELAAFKKIRVQAGGSELFAAAFALEDLASYDAKKLYSPNGSYVLEAGSYKIYLGKNSHDSWGMGQIDVPETLVYAEQAKAGTPVGKRESDSRAAENLFDYTEIYMEENGMSVMSRDDFEGTFPTAPAPKAMSDSIRSRIGMAWTDTEHNSAEAGPPQREDNGMTLSMLRGLDYDDPRWEPMLNQLNYDSEEIGVLLTQALYRTAALDSIGKAETKDHDGTAGLTATWGGNEKQAAGFGFSVDPIESACSYPCSSLQAATWDQELMREFGSMVGEEAIANGINGWYAPGLNLHRTPYGGRGFEYFSEDPVLTGYMAASVVSGAFEKGGLIAYIKHFALNETDDRRSDVAVWADEQTCRQLYLKAFEICVKEARGQEVYLDAESGGMQEMMTSACRAVMTSMNYVGIESPTNSHTMLTSLLRGEWGFCGMVLTDFTRGTYKSPEIGYQIGNDLWMGISAVPLDLTATGKQWRAREAVHRIAYVVVNSNAYDGVAPGGYVSVKTPLWKAVVQAGVAGVCLACAFGLGFTVWRARDERKHPGRYQRDKSGGS